ncbi:MAG: ubiquinol-cytochrome c reductase iron-sulfur subunit [Mesorhizobium amorphae]|nr:MAG: ubiquinol-cytochrome c reductase iron-sulfur subunit [Mesorhizobium amorphae]
MPQTAGLAGGGAVRATLSPIPESRKHPPCPSGTDVGEKEQLLSTHDVSEPTRRDFLYVATGAAAAVGAVGLAWPFIDQMRPDASTLALATVDVDVSTLEPGMSLTAKWRGKPIFIRNRTPQEVEEANAVPLADLKDPLARNDNVPADAQATDILRSAGEGKENWIVMVGSCTHLGCVPLGQAGDFGGWFCPCHGSHYDTAGRIRLGPAPQNLAVPTFAFLTDTQIRIG